MFYVMFRGFRREADKMYSRLYSTTRQYFDTDEWEYDFNVGGMGSWWYMDIDPEFHNIDRFSFEIIEWKK